MLRSLKSDFFLCEIPVGSDMGTSLDDKKQSFLTLDVIPEFPAAGKFVLTAGLSFLRYLKCPG